MSAFYVNFENTRLIDFCLVENHVPLKESALGLSDNLQRRLYCFVQSERVLSILWGSRSYTIESR